MNKTIDRYNQIVDLVENCLNDMLDDFSHWDSDEEFDRIYEECYRRLLLYTLEVFSYFSL